jgi:hypothetical protein
VRAIEKAKATDIGALMDIRDEEVENASTPASPDRAAFWPVKLPAGMKFTPI